MHRAGKNLHKAILQYFFGHVQVVKDKLEPGGVRCVHIPKTAVNVTHSHVRERCIVCPGCWENIKTDHIKGGIDEMGCTPRCTPQKEAV